MGQQASVLHGVPGITCCIVPGESVQHYPEFELVPQQSLTSLNAWPITGREVPKLDSRQRDSCQRGCASSSVPSPRKEVWLNGVMTTMWPRLGPLLSRMVERKLTECLNRKFAQIPLINSARLGRVDFGKKPPEIGPVYEYRTVEYQGDEGMEIDMHLKLDANVDAKLKVGPVVVGVDHISFNGTACFIFGPLNESSPILGGIQIFFMNTPTIDLHLTGLGGITEMSSVKPHIRHTIESAFSSCLVLPERVAWKLTSDKDPIDGAMWRLPPPIAVIKIWVLEAKDLAPPDFAIFKKNSSNPFVKLRVGECEFQTHTISGNQNPCWGTDACGQFLVHNLCQWLHLEVMDDSMMKTAESLGSLPCNLSIGKILRLQSLAEEEAALNAADPQSASIWVDLDLHGDSVLHDLAHNESRVKLRAEYLEVLAHKQPHPFEEPHGILMSVHVHQLTGLGDKAEGAVVKVHMGGKQFDTGACRLFSLGEMYNLDENTVSIIQKLHSSRTASIESIAELVQVDRQLVELVITAKHRGDDYQHWGWDDVFHEMIVDPKSAVVRLELYLAKTSRLRAYKEVHMARFCDFENTTTYCETYDVRCSEGDAKIVVAWRVHHLSKRNVSNVVKETPRDYSMVSGMTAIPSSSLVELSSHSDELFISFEHEFPGLSNVINETLAVDALTSSLSLPMVPSGRRSVSRLCGTDAINGAGSMLYLANEMQDFPFAWSDTIDGLPLSQAKESQSQHEMTRCWGPATWADGIDDVVMVLVNQS